MKKISILILVFAFSSCTTKPEVGTTVVQSADTSAVHIEKVRFGTGNYDYIYLASPKNTGRITVTYQKQSGKTHYNESISIPIDSNRVIEASAIIYEDSTMIILRK